MSTVGPQTLADSALDCQHLLRGVLREVSFRCGQGLLQFGDQALDAGQIDPDTVDRRSGFGKVLHGVGMRRIELPLFLVPNQVPCH